MSRNDTLPAYPHAVSLVSRAVMSSICRVRTEGLDRPVPNGPLIVVSNHLSDTDPPLLWGWLAPAIGRPFRFLAKDSLLHGPVGAAMRSFGAIPVRHDGADASALRMALASLAAGDSLLLAPEGTRSHDGRMGRPRPGSALLAIRSGATMLPVGISGTDRLLARGRRLPRVGTFVTLRMGAPFRLSRQEGAERRTALAAAEEQIMRRIATLVDPRHRGEWEPWSDA